MKQRNHAAGDPLSGRCGLTFGVMLVIATLTAAPPAGATATANSSLQLESLTITPASGSVVFSPTAQSFAQAQNSLGELVTNFDTGVTASSSATVTWVNASGSADSISQTGSALANVNIPGSFVGAASSVGRGVLYDFSFSITGTTGIVSVQFGAMLNSAQSLMTDALGLQATSEVIFDLTIDGQTLLFTDSPFTIGPSQSFTAGGPVNLNSTMDLTAGQTYNLYLELDAESSAINTPEPATLSLLAGALVPLLYRRLRPSRP